MNKLSELIKKLSKEDLIKVQQDLDEGHISKLLRKRLENVKTCPVCNADVHEEGWVLIFGEADFRKKAHFDGPDCLEYFLHKMKKTTY